MRVILLLFCFALARTLHAAELQFSFGEMALNGSLTNFHAALLGGGGPVAWKVVEDEIPSALAPLTDRAENVARRSVLAQTSRDTTDERFPMFIYDGEKFRDFKFTTRFKIVAGAVEQMAGVVLRFQNASNFYVIRVSALGNNVGFYKVVNGARVTPVILPAQIATNVWHELTVDCAGIYLECSLDGKKVLPTITDKSPPDGKIGFWTKSDAVTYFTDATVSYTPIIPAAQALVSSVMRQQPRILGLWLYVLGDHDTTSIIASKDGVDLGQLGTEAELGAIRDGTIYFGRDHGAVLITMPLHDRNGDNIAAVRFKLASFFGETQNNALMRATMLQKLMQELCTSVEDLRR